MKSNYIVFTPDGKRKTIVSFFLTTLCLAAFCQQDTLVRKNVIKVDLTTLALFDNAFTVTYERVIKRNQSISFSAGLQQMPSLLSPIGTNSLSLSRNTASGYRIAADYRFYLAKENKYVAPRGVYIGPYLSYHSLKNNWDLTIQETSGPQSGTIDGSFNIFNIGFQTGYQFLIKNRWSIDLSFIGASYSNYRVKMDINGDFDLENSEISQELLDAIGDKFLILGDLINNGEVDRNGNLNSWGFGLRYLVQVGYAFGGNGVKKRPKNNQ